MEKNLYTALDVAKYVVNKCTTEKCPITNLQLQKILYFLQKEYLVSKDVALFSDEIYAWQFGPVVPEVYYQYCGFGSGAITMKYEIEIDNEDSQRIDPIVCEKRDKDPWDLVNETHTSGKAWDLVYNDGIGNRRIIPKKLIKEKG